MIGQGVNVVSAVAEDAGVPVDITDFRLSGDDAFKARPGCGAHLMILYAAENSKFHCMGRKPVGATDLTEEVSFQLSAISYQLSAFSCQLSAKRLVIDR